MDKDQLYSVLFEQQKDFAEEMDFVPREITPQVLPLFRLKLPLIITGVRRSGKSTLLKIIKKELQLQEKEWFYVNFNDERLISFNVEDFQKINDFLIEEGYKEQSYIFLDEIQEVEKWEKWIDRLKEKHFIAITGSNSKLLSKEISTVLTGRSININLYPFSFREFLSAKKISIDKFKIDLKKQAQIRHEFTAFLNEGGIPKCVIEREEKILTELYENIMYRDIVKRFSLRLEKQIKEASSFLISNVSKEISLRSLSQVTGIKNLSTIKTILETFEKSFLFYFTPKFDYSLRKQIQNSRKTYCVDNGFVTAVGFRTSEDRGRLLENLTFLELKRRNKEVYYFSEKGECDFIIKEGTKIKEAFQVSYEINSHGKEREINGLVAAMQKFNLSEGMILTFDQQEEIKIKNQKIFILPIWKWLLENNKT